MRANLDDLQARAGGGQGGRGELIARYNAQCANAPSRSPNLLEALFGQQKPAEVRDEPLLPEGLDKPERTIDPNIGEVRAGSKAVCVRACDGAFFPVSYSASGGRLDGLEDLCRALCPNADVSLYTYPARAARSSRRCRSRAPGTSTVRTLCGNILQDVRFLLFVPSTRSRAGRRRWRTRKSSSAARTRPTSSSRRRRPPSFHGRNPTPRWKPRAIRRRSRPRSRSRRRRLCLRGRAAPSGTDAYGVDLDLSQQAATISRETSGIADGEAKSGARVGQDQGQTIEVTGPDGVKRRVRIIGPTL